VLTGADCSRGGRIDSTAPTAHAQGTMWGFAEGNKTIIAVVVVLVAIAAVAYVARRLWRR